MSYVKIWRHAVWGTKNRKPVLSKEIRKDLFMHIKQNGKDKGIYIDFINGYIDHVHCLLALNAYMSIAKAIQLIKGESAYWLIKLNLIKPKFEWADEYYATSVSESIIDNISNYIKEQEEHHKKITFSQEYEKFLEDYKIESHG